MSNESQTSVEPSELKGVSQSQDHSNEHEARTEAPELSLRSLAIKVAIGFTLLASTVLFLGYYFRGPLIRISEAFVKLLGGWGVAGGWFLVDAFTFPIPNDAFSFFGLQGGLSFWGVIFWSSLGSVVGGMVGYGVGLLLRRNRRFLGFLEGRGAETYHLVRRYGLLALLIAALTPIPYSIASYACGVVRSHFGWFVLISLARIPRIALYLWVIEKGMLSFSAT